ncbi:uncharacterized protein EV154DRAFT_478165 [Mucor mucedo]|uniref:uncharacterized protein n=1 Tax=Mucor mucedo TaxID=29922 RepID=UPI00221F2EFD|nr:uncharacterized protein EV154DRAFT_478165 [Mucor mucedo]KAI7894771.1 hypothetical protein EV154DRAFT_478165 [Mucor mucedo]
MSVLTKIVHSCVVRLSRTAKPIDNSPYLLLLWYKLPKGEKKRARCNIIYKDSVMIFSRSDGAKSKRKRKKKCFESDLKGDTNPVVYHERLKLCNYQQAPDNIWCQYWFMGSFLVFFSNLDAVIDLPVMILLDLMPQICFMSNQLSDSIFIIDLSAL